MKYKNIETGIVIDVPIFITSPYWESLEEIKTKKISKEETEIEEKIELKETKKEPETNDNLANITKRDIMQELDAFGIKYNPKSTKAELYELMRKGM